MSTILVANHHTANIALPRAHSEGVSKPATILPPATTTPVDKEVWEEAKKNKSVQNYLDRKLIAEVKKADARLSIEERTVDTEANIPEHLQGSDAEGGIEKPTAEGQGQAKAKVRKSKKGTVKVD